MTERNVSFEQLALEVGFENAYSFPDNGFEIVFTDEVDMTAKMLELYKRATRSAYSFERTELRVIQNECAGDSTLLPP